MNNNSHAHLGINSNSQNNKNIKILLVEDDDNFRQLLKTSLEMRYNVTQACNGLQAKDALCLQDFHLVISDIQMPFFNGIELLEWIKTNKNNVRVILCTGFSQILETKTAVELGADDFLTKPFSINDLFEKLDKMFESSNIKDAVIHEDKDLDGEFCKVPIEDFVSEKNTEYGVFVRISNTKYIKISHKGGKLAESRIQNFKEKGVHFLYVHKNDFDKLVGFTIFINNVLNQSQTSLPSEKKLRFLKYTGELVLEHIHTTGIDQKSLLEAKDFLQTTINTISNDNNIFDLLSVMSTHTDYLYIHGIYVSMLAYLIAKEMGYNSIPILFKIAMGGLFHDIGKKEIPKEILSKGRHQLTQQEVEMFESHVIRGKEILEAMGNIPAEVITIVYEHHENFLGQGYPRQLDKKRINPLAQIVSVADIFAEYTLKEFAQSTTVLPALDALQKIEFQKKDYINESAFAALKSLMKKK